MSPMRLVKFILFWLAAWVVLGTLAVGSTIGYGLYRYAYGDRYYRERYKDTMGFPGRWQLLSVLAAAGVSAAGAAFYHYLRRGKRRGVEVDKDGFLVYRGPEGVRVAWGDVVTAWAGPDEDLRVVALRFRVDGRPGVLKVLETHEGFAELKEKLHDVLGAPATWLAAATAGRVVLYNRSGAADAGN